MANADPSGNMKTVEEIVFSKQVFIESLNPYNLSLDILDNFSGFGKVTEKKHEYKTDGPRKIVNIEFEVEDEVDSHSSIKFTLRINGEHNEKGSLTINMTGSFNLKMSGRKGFGSETFSEYYFENLFPSLKSNAIEKIEKLGNIMESRISELSAKQ